jgi:hypothetical protein
MSNAAPINYLLSPCPIRFTEEMCFPIEAVPKLQFLEQLPIKIVVLQAVGRKTTKACDKTTGFGTSSINMPFLSIT